MLAMDQKMKKGKANPDQNTDTRLIKVGFMFDLRTTFAISSL